jgi:hypothetical protein
VSLARRPPVLKSFSIEYGMFGNKTYALSIVMAVLAALTLSMVQLEDVSNCY